MAVTATFRLLYVLVLIEHGSRRLVHFNVTHIRPQPGRCSNCGRRSAAGDAYRYLLHDRDSIFAKKLDESIRQLGLTVLKSPPHSPKANAICERVIGTIRRECLDWPIPISELHLRSMLKHGWTHYNEARPHMALGPGVPDPPSAVRRPPTQLSRHRIGRRLVLRVKSILGGLHHEYSLAPALR